MIVEATKTSARLQLEYEIKAQAQLLRAISEATAAAAGTNPIVLLSSCDNIRTIAVQIEALANRVRDFTH